MIFIYGEKEKEITRKVKELQRHSEDEYSVPNFVTVVVAAVAECLLT